MEWYKMMAIPIWIMEFFGEEVYSRFPSSKWKKELQVKETMDALLQALTIFPNVFFSPSYFHMEQIYYLFQLL